MARTVLNSAIKSIHGGIDNWVFRRQSGKTTVGPLVAPTDPKTPAQMTVREQFRLAAAYARAAYADPTARSAYAVLARARELPLYAAIMGDFLNPPSVDSVDLSGYHGAVGNPVNITASDDAGVTAVNVAIRGADQTVLEQGAATLTEGVWVYHATTARTAGQTVTITATAVDRPGHTGTQTETWTMP